MSRTSPWVFGIATATVVLMLAIVAVAPAGAQRAPGGPRPVPRPPDGVTLTETWTANPTSGAALWVGLARPAGEERLPVLVMVPGGRGSGGDTFRGAGVDAWLAAQGYAVVIFDPDGRGQSEGSEDFDGFIHQDGLAAVIRLAAALPGVDATRLGLVTYSYGITMGAGALARYPDLPVAFLIDWEGPDNRFTTGCASPRGGLSHDCADDAYWSEREASTFIRSVAVPYQRIQSARDHVQRDAHHAVAMVNAATDMRYGGGGVSRFTRLNDEAPNQTYTPAMLPPLPEEDAPRWREARIARYARDLVRV